MNLGDKKSVISVRVSSDFYSWLSNRAEFSALSVSDYVRYILEDFKRAVEISEAIEKYNRDFCHGDQQTDLDDKL